MLWSRDHNRTLHNWRLIRYWVTKKLWRELYGNRLPRYQQIMIFENKWASIGQTQYHPHGQACGVSVIPPTLERGIQKRSFSMTWSRGCPFYRVREELSDGKRQVAANRLSRAFCHLMYAILTRLISPRQHVSRDVRVRLHDLTELLLTVIRGFNAPQW